MNIGQVGRLGLHPLPGNYRRTRWHHAVLATFASRPLAWQHTRTSVSRFKSAAARFPLLYFAPDPFTALLEVRSLLGHPRAGSIVVLPGFWHVVQVSIHLDRVADLRTTNERQCIETTVQELTGDWIDYAFRTSNSPEIASDPPAPTQELGASLHGCLPDCQGFLTPSAKSSVFPNLVVFPDRVHIDHDNRAVESRQRQ